MPDLSKAEKKEYKALKAKKAAGSCTKDEKARLKVLKQAKKAWQQPVSSTKSSDEPPAKRVKTGSAAPEPAEAAPPPQDAFAPFAKFGDAPFAAEVQAALSGAGFAAPSPIQARSWPAILAGQDLISVAKTGSGKTLAFLLPAFHALAAGAKPGGKAVEPRALVLAPTRELAMQIHGECAKFGNQVGIASTCIYGGVPVSAQVSEMKSNKPDVVVATPGRLVDLLERQALSLHRAAYAVLDEADRMLDMGFEPEIKKIFAATPATPDRQTLLFSATWPKSIRKLAKTYLRKGEVTEIFVGEGAGPDAELEANKAITQTFFEVRCAALLLLCCAVLLLLPAARCPASLCCPQPHSTSVLRQSIVGSTPRNCARLKPPGRA